MCNSAHFELNKNIYLTNNDEIHVSRSSADWHNHGLTSLSLRQTIALLTDSIGMALGTKIGMFSHHHRPTRTYSPTTILSLAPAYLPWTLTTTSPCSSLFEPIRN